MAVRIIIIIARKVMNITNMSPKYVAHGPSVCANDDGNVAGCPIINYYY